ncbi:MAG: hypothetical protein CNLJKLNK_01070 [Holosporales bacterium]
MFIILNGIRLLVEFEENQHVSFLQHQGWGLFFIVFSKVNH